VLLAGGLFVTPVHGEERSPQSSKTAAERPLVERPKDVAEVRGVRHWSYPGFSRVWIELSRPAEPRVNHLPADSKAGRPERLYLDLEGVWVGRDHNEPIRVGDGLLEGVRLGQNTPTTTRVVIDLQRYERHRVLSLQGPDRVVIDVFGPAGAPPSSRAGRASPGVSESPRAEPARVPPQESVAPAKPLPFDLRPVRTVVLDPGHGGRDPGAIGVGGTEEKDVRARLRERGFRVVMTRDDDRTLDLEERTAIAEGAGGDVFVSLHCNAAPRPGLHGIETYSLNESDEQHSVQVAARENGIALEEVDVLQRTVAQLRVSEASGPSWVLAELVHHQLVQGLRERYEGVNDLGVKKGPFYVLFLSSMPSILIEAGFLTHHDEAKRLHSRAYLARLAESVAEGLSLYRERGRPLIARSAR
jgi:N-acetylmuramoyl-L-alanine amidase